ncbi:MAG: GTPase ObgE [Candidatus Sumerlaeia bacterium]|nr:GTPase ObgE [Candidatus Sumerlaeia bacterium]
MNFVDHVRVQVRAGDGGKGCISFRREKFVPRGGPDGGDGGRGGSVWAVADPHLVTLYDLKLRPAIRAGDAGHGGGAQCTGRDGEDVTIPVPLGTVITDAETDETLGEILHEGDRLLLAKGGDGGKGNQHFATPQNRAPRKATDGFPGEERRLLLDLKIIADAGLVGLPNAGKSTLLAALTRATPKIAPYPFTTLHPNLGVLALPRFGPCTLADIPGLIEGAHRGLGLGDRFLRHIERTRLLIHLVPVDADPGHEAEALWYQFELVNSELRSYSGALAARPQIVVLTKADLSFDEEIAAITAHFRARGAAPIVIAAAEGQGLEPLVAEIDRHLAAMVPGTGEEADKP